MVSPATDSPRRRRVVQAPAKINLGLRVVARRADGYHELESLFVPIDLSDELVIEVAQTASSRSEVEIRVAGRSEGVPADDSNLAVRAARGFADRAGLRIQIGLQIDKQIPTGAGLGGGSSDAAAVLSTLHELFPGSIGPADLAALALEIGADVPFFLDPKPSWVSGIGERIEPVSGVPALPLLLANPGEVLETREVFRGFDALNPTLTEDSGDRTLPPLRKAGEMRWESIASHVLRVQNDLEPAAIRLCPPVARLLTRIRQTDPKAAGMSGSGATVFGVFESNDLARGALETIGFEASEWARVATTIESR